MFKAICKENLLFYGNPESNNCIVCCWTEKEKIAKKVSSKDFAAIGQLYSAERGIDFLIRNLLANPQLTNLIITGTDFSNSGKVLGDFFEKGFNEAKLSNSSKSVWKINSKFNGFIDSDIPEKALNDLRKGIKVFSCKDISSFDFSGLSKKNLSREKLVFAKKNESVEQLPAEESVFVVRHKTVAGAWLQAMDTILKFGKTSETRFDSRQKEVLNMVSVISGEDPENLFFPDFFPFDKKHFEGYLPKILTNFEDKNIEYSYGNRIFGYFGLNQFEAAIEKLSDKPDERTIVIDLWDSAKDLQRNETPCINHFWFKIVEKKLFLTVTIRSNDMFAGYPENALALRRLQGRFREELNKLLKQKGKTLQVDLGDLIINSQSAHLYDDCWEAAKRIVDENFEKFVPKRLNWFDFRGNFLVYLSKEQIIVEHFNNENQFLQKFEAKTAYDLWDKLSRANIVGNTSHAIYLGTELMKAEIALKNNLKFEQDKELEIK